MAGLSVDTDNRTSEDVYQYQEARIEALLRRVKELEQENAQLRERLKIQ